jgi:hypothetical protein
MKFSKNFERDYNWYYKYRETFTFSGSMPRKIENSPSGKSAKECFHLYDSQGKIAPCREPDLLSEILLCKESVNFQIKEWAQDRAIGYLPLVEFETIIEEYELLEWMVNAVERQKCKYYKIE